MRAGKAIATGIALSALVAGAGSFAVSRVDPAVLNDLLTDTARAATGREVLVRGATKLRLFPSPTLIAENVVIGNPPWSVSPDMARVKQLEARVGFLPLFLGQLRLSRFRLLEPHVFLERDSKGRRSWDLEVATEHSEENEFLARMQSRLSVVVSKIQIVDGTFSYREDNKTYTIRISNLSARGDVAGGRLDLVGRGQFNGRGWKFSGSVGELSALLRNEPYDLGFVLSTKGIRLTGEGVVERPLDGAGLRMDLKLKARSGGEVLALAGFDLDLPGAVHGSATLTDVDGGLRLDALKAEARIKGGHLTVGGSVGDLVDLRGVKLTVDVKARSLAGIVHLAGVDLPAVGPVTAKARLSRTRHGYKLAELDARIGRSDAGGELYIYPHRKRPRIVGSLKAKNLDLDQLLPGTGKRRRKRVFSAEPLSLALLKTFDADVSIHARKLHVQGLRMDNVKAGMSLTKGRLQFTPAGRLGGGKISAKLSVDTRGKRPRIATRIRGKGIGLGEVSAQIYDTQLIEGARADVNIDVIGRGNSVAELMAGLSGGIYVAAGKATIHNRRLEKVSSDVVTALLSTVAMQSPEDETTHVRCGVVRVLVKDGLVRIDRTVAMETTGMVMSASGSIDFGDEGLDLGVTLAGRRGPSLGLASFSGLVRVRGTMAEPEVGADAVGIAGAAVTVAGAVATSGLSLLVQGLISQIAADRSTCRTALEIDNSG